MPADLDVHGLDSVENRNCRRPCDKAAFFAEPQWFSPFIHAFKTLNIIINFIILMCMLCLVYKDCPTLQVFVCGLYPHWLFITSRGSLRVHPMSIDGPINCFAPFHNVNCPNGFLYFNKQVNILFLPEYLVSRLC